MPNTTSVPSVAAAALGDVQRPTGPFPDFDTAAAAYRDRQRLVQQVTDEVVLRAELDAIASELERLA